MNRTDRLYAMVEELRARAPRPVSAPWLAGHYEVSTRTIERDLAALQQGGVPIWAQPGPGGGYSLDPATTLPPVNLTAEEATAVAIALAASRGLPFADAGRAALQKLRAVMPATQKAKSERLNSKLLVLGDGPPRNTPPTLRASLRPVEEALEMGRALELRYRDRNGVLSARVVEPGALMAGRHGWYLLAYCRLRHAGRAFRLDRLDSARVLADGFEPRPLAELLGDDFPYNDDLRSLGQLMEE